MVNKIKQTAATTTQIFDTDTWFDDNYGIEYLTFNIMLIVYCVTMISTHVSGNDVIVVSTRDTDNPNSLGLIGPLKKPL